MVFEGIREIALLRRYVERIFAENPELSAGLEVTEVLERVGIDAALTAAENFEFVKKHLAGIGLKTTAETEEEARRALDEYANVQSASFLSQIIDALKDATPEELEEIKAEIPGLAPEDVLRLREEIERLRKELLAERLKKPPPEPEIIAREMRRTIEATERRLLDEIASLRDEFKFASQELTRRVEEKAEARLEIPSVLEFDVTPLQKLCQVHLGEAIARIAKEMFGKEQKDLTEGELEEVMRRAEDETWANPIALVETYPQIFELLQELQDVHGRYLFPRGEHHWYWCDYHKSVAGITTSEVWYAKLARYMGEGVLTRKDLKDAGIPSAWIEEQISKAQRSPRAFR